MVDFEKRCSHLKTELKDLQGAYDIAMKEITRLRGLLGYDLLNTGSGKQ